MIEKGAWIWTRRQRAVLAVVILITAAILGVRAYRNPLHIDDPQPPSGTRTADLATRIDPNTADWPAWSALPLIGEKHAREIVTFRDTWSADHPGETPFAKPEDLMRVKGIGKATVESLRPYLTFPEDATKE